MTQISAQIIFDDGQRIDCEYSTTVEEVGIDDIDPSVRSCTSPEIVTVAVANREQWRAVTANGRFLYPASKEMSEDDSLANIEGIVGDDEIIHLRRYGAQGMAYCGCEFSHQQYPLTKLIFGNNHLL